MQKRCDTIVSGDIRILQDEGSFCYSTDTLLLLEFINDIYDFSKPTKVLELGSGTGGLCLVIARSNPEAKVSGVELQERLVGLSNESAAMNDLSNVSFVRGDLRNIREMFHPESFNLVVANPPYFKLGTGKVNVISAKAQAKHEIKSTLSDFMNSAHYLLKKTGTLCMIHHYSRIYDVFENASKLKMKLHAFAPVYQSAAGGAEGDATHGLFAFSKSGRAEPRTMAPRYIRACPAN